MTKERILVTGANGNLGGALVKELVDNAEYEVIALCSEESKVYSMIDREQIVHNNRVSAMSNNTFFNTDWSAAGVTAGIHMAFSRANQPKERIANSLDFSRDVYRRLHELGIPRTVYLSSQSIYGSTSEWRSEYCIPAPETVYSMAKYAGEKLLETEFAGTATKYSVLRLDYVIQSQKLVPALCRSAKETCTIKLQGGKQTFSYIDKSDAVKAISALLNYKGIWQKVYNVGPNRMRYTLFEVAEVVAKVAEEHGAGKVNILLDKNDTLLWAGMDSSRFINDTGWYPLMDFYQMVGKIYEEI